MTHLGRNLHNRTWMVERLRAELVGPDLPIKQSEQIVLKRGRFISWEEFNKAESQVNDTPELPLKESDKNKQNKDIFITWEEFRKPKVQANGEEILWQDSPIKRYGAGILFPYGITELKQLASEADSTLITDDEVDAILKDSDSEEAIEKAVSKKPEKIKVLADDTEDYEVTLANAFRPSAMGLSFLADLSLEKEGFIVEVNCARYVNLTLQVGNSIESEKKSERRIWLRERVLFEGNNPVERYSTADISKAGSPIKRWLQGQENKLQLVIIIRSYNNSKNLKLITISLVNRQKRDSRSIDELCFFQTGIRISGLSNTPWIVPYPEILRTNRKAGDEEEIVRLLYRDRQTFAIGHGCSASWIKGYHAKINEVWTECLPTYETPRIIADLKDKESNQIRVSMRKLAGLDPNDDGTNEIRVLLEAYRNWITDLKDFNLQIYPVPDNLKGTCGILIDRCEECLKRIEDGITFLSSDTPKSNQARKAFQLANHAMLIAQLRATRDVREPAWSDGRISWSSPIPFHDPAVEHPTKGYWRAFQIAFLLMSLRGICESDHKDRLLVDLIWFPTGGGKTEAYLGLTAFTVFFNRLSGSQCDGVNVLMRYTLRLLTAQQFQRAALLLCSMEILRRSSSELGNKPFRLGMWVGGAATPNKRSEARAKLSALTRDPDAENPFVLLKCPWCGAKFGTIEDTSTGVQKKKFKKSKIHTQHRTLGYNYYSFPGSGEQTVVFRCPDINCDFGFAPGIKEQDPLPILVIDQDIYEFPPDLIIGTVDKFAMLSWNPDIRSIFGLNNDGKHDGIPPTLIIQDELHLISGPLGSMVGAYETAIEELCTKRSNTEIIRPKIIASTATISRAEDQIIGLYARDRVMLFPPSGINASDSFFAREERNEDESLNPGRLYVGVLAPGHGSLQTTEARVFASLLQWPLLMEVLGGDDSERDPWWTLLAFFNSLRELGGAASLLVADTRDYLRVILDRHGFPYNMIRQLLYTIELTSRMREDYIPKAIQSLEKRVRRDTDGFLKDAVEVCLASNIIEVGVDIDRLSLITIVGQPKTTSQYIQVSSRIGRSLDAPGLAVVVYSQSKPRDRSHYERFRSYHQRLYAQVEPTSVTPFSPPAVERAIHGVLMAIARQILPKPHAETPRPFPLEKSTNTRALIDSVFENRVDKVDASEKGNVLKSLKQRFNEWKAWDPSEYGGFGPPPSSPPLLHPAGSKEQHTWCGHSWATLSSLRDVDATCEAEVTKNYNEALEDPS